MDRHFRDYMGRMVKAPDDLPTVIASLYDGLIVWSKGKDLHQVRYGLQVNSFGYASNAADEFKQCILHHKQNEGVL